MRLSLVIFVALAVSCGPVAAGPVSSSAASACSGVDCSGAPEAGGLLAAPSSASCAQGYYCHCQAATAKATVKQCAAELMGLLRYRFSAKEQKCVRSVEVDCGKDENAASDEETLPENTESTSLGNITPWNPSEVLKGVKLNVIIGAFNVLSMSNDGVFAELNKL